MAIFPRKINGRYVMSGRLDGENLFILESDNPLVWNEVQTIPGAEILVAVLSHRQLRLAHRDPRGLADAHTRRRADAAGPASALCCSTSMTRLASSGN